jgi:hypothetical protein
MRGRQVAGVWLWWPRWARACMRQSSGAESVLGCLSEVTPTVINSMRSEHNTVLKSQRLRHKDGSYRCPYLDV